MKGDKNDGLITMSQIQAYFAAQKVAALRSRRKKLQKLLKVRLRHEAALARMEHATWQKRGEVGELVPF